ncbi:cobalt-precorrin 5A hydrolase [Desulfurispora thermophila]|uniref:cobalt-precorrin 5A hydrolase n=1 Tax=Desulfurispora thermophila TaxID=265470 RepID=UPI00037F87D1|nr:cobalt-precorrin 5A hydrolase [Desulfurispora thermophila]
MATGAKPAGVAVLVLAPRSLPLAGKIATNLVRYGPVRIYCRHCQPGNTLPVANQVLSGPITVQDYDSLPHLLDEIWGRFGALVLVMSLGIVMRLVAPRLRSKTIDPAVLVVDEAGRFVISAASGHLGGANDLTALLARALGAQPVITTATDGQGLLAPDLLAGRYRMAVHPLTRIKEVNAALLAGQRIVYYSDWPLPEPGIDQRPLLQYLAGEREGDWQIVVSDAAGVPEPARGLLLIPRRLVLGVGCRRGVAGEAVCRAVQQALAGAGRRMEAVKALATVDLRSGEPALEQTAAWLGVPLLAYDRRQIGEIMRARPGEFSFSPYVEQKIGVGGVCEPVSLLACQQGRLLLAKQKMAGVTVAIAEDALWWSGWGRAE